MNPVELVKRDLGPVELEKARVSWQETAIIQLDEQLSVLPSFRTYMVQGSTGQFDFPMLPHCSYAYYVANGSEAIRLTRKGKEIEGVLARDWEALPQLPAVQLASLILPFYDAGIKGTHSVVPNANSLHEMCQPPRAYRLDQHALAAIESRIGETSVFRDDRIVIVRAVTLCGWMHMKGNLGIETIRVSQDGRVTLAPREVLSPKIFQSFPALRY